MDYDRLWAPWRLSYVAGTDRPPGQSGSEAALLAGGDPDCFLCRAAADAGGDESRDRENLVIERGPLAVVLLNRYPYNNGHLLVAPRLHQARLDELSEAQQLELSAELTRWTAVLEQRIKAEGFNVGLNLGRVAGAGVPRHLHWHIVPRWAGDTNFMPAVAGARVIPQALDELWLLLREEVTPSSNCDGVP
jgi:ATP adenylyltransferase